MFAEKAYKDTLEYMYALLPMYSRIGAKALKPSLENTLKLCKAIGNPQENIKFIHVAGTNGKGSTSHALASVFQSAGYQVGLYTSPHLKDFRERIRINGEMISKEFVIQFIEKIKPFIEKIKPSFFEITVAMCFEAFAVNNVDIAIIETGLGGRLDSTNIIQPILSIITHIALDHTDLLGNHISEIAFEKAGIIKANTPVIIGKKQPEIDSVFIEKSNQTQSQLYYAETEWTLERINQDNQYQYFSALKKGTKTSYNFFTDLLGIYQKDNLATVLTAIDWLEKNGLKISVEKAFEAFSKIMKTTGLHGRYEIVKAMPKIIVDVAHNLDGMQAVLSQWNLEKERNKHIVIGFVKDKDIESVLSLFSNENTHYYFCNANIPRALSAQDLQLLAQKSGINGNYYGSVKAAIIAAEGQLNNDDALLITGSFFVVGEALDYLNQYT